MNRPLPWLAICAVLFCGTSAAQSRTWTDSTGRYTVEAEFVSVAGGQVTLKKTDGQEITLPLDRLSAADREFVKTREGGTAAGSVARGRLKGPILSQVVIEKWTLEPPTIEFTAEVDLLGDAEVAELWGTVDTPEGGKIVDVVAGAIYQGILRLEIDGIDLMNPPPGYKLQRGTLERKANSKQCIGKVTFPQIALPKSSTTMFLLASDNSGNKGNLLRFTIDLETGKVTGGQVKSKAN